MSEHSYVVGTVIEGPQVVSESGHMVARSLLDCGNGRHVAVEGPVACVATPQGSVTAGMGACLFRYQAGRSVAVVGTLSFAPVRIVLEKVMPRDRGRPVVSMAVGPIRFVGYRATSARSAMPEADVDLLDGQHLRVVLPENVFAQPGSYLMASLAWSRKRGWRAPYRLSNVCAWRPVAVPLVA